MTRYFCADPSHRRRGEVIPVDVTAQVRAERELIPRPGAYFATTEAIVAGIADMDPLTARTAEIARLLTGTADPIDLPVVLMSQRTVSRAPGHYELDDLRRNPEIEAVLARVGAPVMAKEANDDVILIVDEDRSSTRSSGQTAVLTKPTQRTRIIPQGLFRLNDLVANLAVTDATEAEIVDAIRSTPVYDVPGAPLPYPWRVVITCPKPEGSPAVEHRSLFTGTGAPEPSVSFGVPAGAWELATEDSATRDMAPGKELVRVERRVGLLMGVEALMVVALLMFGWLSGTLAQAADSTPAWLGLSIILAGAAVAFAAIPLFGMWDPAANMNDTFVVRRLYESRISMLRWAAAVSAVLIGFALMAGIIPPLLAEVVPVPSASITFDAAASPVTATMHVHASGLGAGETVDVTMRQYTGAADRVGTLVGDVSRNGNPSGSIAIAETFALDPGARFVSVLVSMDKPGLRVGCDPAVSGNPGCTVLAVPAARQPVPGTVTNIVVSPGVAPGFTPPPTSPSPSP